MAESKELKKIKKVYGENFMKLCRELFPTLLEQGKLYEILSSTFSENSKTLYEDIVEAGMKYSFKEYIYSKVDEENLEKNKTEKTPYALLEEAGYELIECKTERDIQKFRKYYEPDEELCTFNGERLERCVVFFAVKKNAKDIKREDFINPQREDEYGTSVMSIQFNKEGMCTVSIKNRYNHTVENPDATYGNNLDRIIPGLTDSFLKLLQKQMSFAKLELIVTNKKSDLQVAKTEYETLTNQSIELSEIESGAQENELINQLNEAKKKRDRLTESIQAKRELRMSFVNENDKIEEVLKQSRASLRHIQSQMTEMQVDKAKQETEVSNYLLRLNDEYKMTFEFAKEEYSKEINMNEAKETVRLLRHQIESLGHVNLQAIEDYEEVSTRYETLNSQRLDLIAAQDSILKAIEEMDEIMVTRFSETFEKINKEFNVVFRNLFGGGHAELKYSEPDNILETGIDIDVQPPGKAVQNITLFSGGEKALIAISCLFAILRVRPVPMCILDEVEAALDVANVERFAKYLREFSSQTQFIVVTHREGTMEECDLLYGATMQQKGVTKLVSVKLKDAIDMAQSA